MTRPCVLAFLVLALLGTAVHAQPASLVKDIRDQTFPADWPQLSEFDQLGGIAYFTMSDPVHGTELWRSDGSEAGTWLVSDICPGICSSAPAGLTAAGGVLYFIADDGIHGHSLWKTDGTPAGTVLVRAVRPYNLVELGGVLVFTGSLPGTGRELWRSDGTTAGTIPLGDLWPGPDGSDPVPLGYAGNLLLFSAADPVHGRELWKTDGTAAGTTFLKDLAPGTGGSLPEITRGLYPAIAGRLFFPGSNKLWVSDGTAAGTSQVATVLVQPTYLAALGDQVFFVGVDHRGAELWKSNGTAAGTALVKDLKTGSGNSNPGELFAVGDVLYFRAASSFYQQLWKSDGTEAGTVPIKPGGLDLVLEDGYNAFLALGNELVLFASDGSHGREPWKSDGTAAGTVLLGDLYPGELSSYGNFLFPLSRLDGGVVVGGEWIFRALVPDDGWTLWKSDGTPAGTQLVKTFDVIQASGLSAFSPKMVDLGGILLFDANDGTTGQELWRSDGTAPGTSFVLDYRPGLENSNPSLLTRFGSSVFFSSFNSLLKTDGTEPGTESFSMDFRGELAAGNSLYYLCNGGFFDALCRTDDGTVPQVAWSLPNASASRLAPAGPNLFFRGTVEGEAELWKVDNTPDGTRKLDIAPGASSSDPESITGFGSSAFLTADDGSSGRELWFSDGAVAGTRRVKDIVPGPGTSNPRSLVKAGNLVFFLADDGIAGEELWRSDGTTAGTVLVADIRPGAEPSWIHEITAVGDRVFFVADDGVHGVELWVSDGSTAGTHIVKDAVPGAGSSYPRYLKVAGHLLYFAADNGTDGLEPWKTDGTEAGTAMIQDVNPGEAPSTPTGFVISGPYLYFTANDGAHGFELWALDRSVDFHTVPPCRVFDTRATSALSSGVVRTFTVAGTCGVPSGATAVAANLTVIGPTGTGRVVVYPSGLPVPVTSNLNFQAGLTRANNAVIGLTAGQVDALATMFGGSAVHLVLDVAGYYQ